MQTDMYTLHRPILFLLVGTLVACSGIPQKSSEKSKPDIEMLQTQTEDPKDTIKRYRQLSANSHLPADKQYYALLIAETQMESGDIEKASETLFRINLAQLNSNYHSRVDLLEAELAIQKGQTPIALQKLPKRIIDFPPRVQARILKVRATALHELGYTIESLLARMRLAPLLSNPDAVDANNAAIWSSLNALPEEKLSELSKSRLNPNIRGWVDLVTGLRQVVTTRKIRDDFLASWYSRYPSHPAADRFLDKLKSNAALIPEYPQKIALLLPLGSQNDKLAKAAEAIRDGFMATYYNSEHVPRPQIRILDVGDDPEQIWTYLQDAKARGAEIIVGPLHKQAVSNLVSAVKLDIPVLALNYSTNDHLNSENVIQFGLAPEDEAKQAAERAIVQKKMRAIVLAPQSSLGNRMHSSFIHYYENLGGTTLASEFYAFDANDHGDTIERVLNIHQSNNRNARLRSIINENIKFEPRRRQDIDLIFLEADPKQARLIMPQLRFHHAGDIPVFASSHVFSGKNNPVVDKDLSGLSFLDAPFVLKTKDNNMLPILGESEKDQTLNVDPRLYALGMDAYRILPFLSNLQSNPFERFTGYTGTIYIDHNNRIHRELVWASFNRGSPEIQNLVEFSEAEE